MYDLTLIVNVCFLPSTYSIDASLVSFPSTHNTDFLSCFAIEKENLQKHTDSFIGNVVRNLIVTLYIALVICRCITEIPMPEFVWWPQRTY